MSELFARRLAQLEDDASLRRSLGSLNRGIEREALRVDPEGYLAKTPHPDAFGSKLTHPYITTDFSEAQPELITPVATRVEEALDFLSDIHRFIYMKLGDELLWSASMPCMLEDDEQVPIAQYGPSNLGRLKTTYRNGLGSRYGRLMQTICAVHYNFSLPGDFWGPHQDKENDTAPAHEFRSARYFDLMRNFRRFSWLPIYLFGASPALCNSFVQGREHALDRFDAGTLYAPFATSLRNGNLGYQSAVQSDAIKVGYNNLDSYTAGLASAITTPHDRYTRLGIRSAEGFLQVSDCYLQSEAEFYTTVRAKCLPPPGVNFLKVMRARGVEYVEVRLLDVNPFLPLGIDADEIMFLDAFLLYCLLQESPMHDDADSDALGENIRRTVLRGRDPALKLRRGREEQSLRGWAEELLTEVAAVAALLDGVHDGGRYLQAVHAQRRRVEEPDATISSGVLAALREEQIPYFRFAMNKALEHRQHLRSTPLPPDRLAEFERLVEHSVEEQQAIEAGDNIGFDEYLERFLRGYREVAAGDSESVATRRDA